MTAPSGGGEAERARRAFARASWSGAATLAVAAGLLLLFPTKAGALPPGFQTPILAFELATDRAEIEALFDLPGSAHRAELVHRMDLGNTADFAFMVAYGGFLALFSLAVRTAGERRALVPAVLGPIGAIFDVLENTQLFAITKALGGDYDGALARLRLFTWLKWETLALALVLLAPWLLRGGGGRVGRVAGTVCALAGLFGALAFFDRTHFAELFSLFLSLGFVGLLVVATLRGKAPALAAR
ncbi:MAG TPA: hypothetical protein VHE30_15350 [Polyangiaceae bacterium]|nr:hypothetical protein [Polyangiaceae bacterium]